MSTPKLLLWIGFVALMIYVFFFGFNRLQQNLSSEFGGTADNFVSGIQSFASETHLDELVSYVKSRLSEITGSKAKPDALSSGTEDEARHKRHREQKPDLSEENNSNDPM